MCCKTDLTVTLAWQLFLVSVEFTGAQFVLTYWKLGALVVPSFKLLMTES